MLWLLIFWTIIFFQNLWLALCFSIETHIEWQLFWKKIQFEQKKSNCFDSCWSVHTCVPNGAQWSLLPKSVKRWAVSSEVRPYVWRLKFLILEWNWFVHLHLMSYVHMNLQARSTYVLRFSWVNLWQIP
jgi:hypothetical protein